MNRNSVLFILLSVVFGVGAVFIARNWLEENQPKDVGADQVAVLTVNVELPTGTMLEDKYLSMKVIPKNSVPQGAFTDKKQAKDMLVKQRLYPGDIVREQRLVKKGEGSSLASLIGKNKRAITLRVNDVVGVAGFLLPGNKVDVLNTFGQGGRPTTQVVLSNVKILAIDQRASNDENKPQVVRAVTLELGLNQAETLLNSRKRGSIQLALRNPNDETNSIILAEKDNQLQGQDAKSSASDEVSKDEQTEQVSLAKTSTQSNSSQEVAASAPRRSAYSNNKVEVIRGVQQQTVQVKN
ncbi:Flp pilus assembly protein CpaB [Thalassotalea litorea]|uniref:Flp pilus assembly protein CpaB n=1 Tax=Thalassotalea litorea TaxID=2020715 RepID=A0A5R9IJL3_9GAMM|nr:Flp pilus assembly protein CpaB [Thalassotalea litorea]TLU61477.1 Flp pilus assembly protein CpaB [Thalassotalea litorea]